MADEEHGEEWGLVEPFVVCSSKGGPYDDQSFVAGVQYARAEAALRVRDIVDLVEFDTCFYPGLVPQLDLMAMRHGYRIEVEPWEDGPDDWAHVTFHRVYR